MVPRLVVFLGGSRGGIVSARQGSNLAAYGTTEADFLGYMCRVVERESQGIRLSVTQKSLESGCGRLVVVVRLRV